MYIRSNVFPLCVYVCASLCTSAWGLRLGVHQRGSVSVYTWARTFVRVYMNVDLRLCVHKSGLACVYVS